MKFIICAPFHDSDHSNGILGMAYLAQTLTSQGHDVKACLMASHPHEEYPINLSNLIEQAQKDPNPYYSQLLPRIKVVIDKFQLRVLHDHSESLINEHIIIYPEVIITNPLKAKNIIRYYGNKPGVLNKTSSSIGANDFILSHSKTLIANAHHVLFFAYVDPAFHDKNTFKAENRTLDLVYEGKGHLYTKMVDIDGAVLITRHWPPSKQQLATLLRHTRFLYTYDSWTNLNLEAILCGAIPIFLHNGPFTDEEIDDSELGTLPRIKFNQYNVSDDFFNEFESERIKLLNRLVKIQGNWHQGVTEFTRKVKKHFQIL